MSLAARLNSRITQLAVGRRLPRRTVHMRLTLLYGGLFLLSGAALLAITYVLFERATEFTKPQLPRVPHTPALEKLQHQLALDRHLLIPASPNAPRAGFPLPTQLARDQHQLAQVRHRFAQTVSQLAGAVHQLSRAGSVQVTQRAADSHQLLVTSGIALAIVAVLALLAGWLVAGRMLRPLRTITRKAQRTSSASLHERLALDGPQDELKELGDTLDDLFGRLDAAFEAQRQVVANASHELRAPLTRQRALIQVALDDPQASRSSLRKAHERVLASERSLEQMIDGLLALTRGQAGLERREQLDLAALTSEAILAREAQAAGLDLDVRTTLTPAPTAGDPLLVERLIANLVDNAITHNVEGGHVQVSTGSEDGKAVLKVTNTGPVIPATKIERLFEPFQRLDSRRIHHNNGHGLGLSIVQAIANAHRATITAQPSLDGGITIEVAFPRPAHPRRGGSDADGPAIAHQDR